MLNQSGDSSFLASFGILSEIALLILFFRFDEAVKDFESALDLDKEFAPAYCNLGIIFMNVNMNYWK